MCLAWVAAVIAMPPPAFADQMFEYSVDRPGNDYHREVFPSNYNEITCQNMCENDGKCSAWTYVKPGIQDARGVCYLKDELPVAYGNDCCISGVIGRPFEIGIDRPGNDYSTIPMEQAVYCRDRCQADRSCAAWTFDHRNLTCWLKAPVADAFPNPCCSSGVIPPRVN